MEYLQAAVDEINNVYGSVEQYTENGIGFTKEQLEALRDLLLEER
ncbi:tyrosine-protein phosphatase [Bacillus sp. S14(2024)]